jgi:chemotaxis protein methyltransferase CheR
MNALAPTHPLVRDPDFPLLKQHVIESTGLAYYADKDADLAARISGRLSQLTLDGCGAYLDLLKNRDEGEPERHLLIGQLTIGETYFFRHTEQFDALRDVALPDAIRRNRERRSLRIWSAGCAIGAEPYSIAILLKEHFADQLAGWDVQVLGTDINQAFLARAARGEFDANALRSASDEFKRNWFVPTGRTWTVLPAVKEAVSFQYHNLVEHPYPSIVHGIVALDLILCRNVMIYFDWDTIGRILGRFHECLNEGGWLAVGHAESNTEVFRGYRTVNVPGATLYQKSHERSMDLTGWKPQASAQQPWEPWSPPVLPSTAWPAPDGGSSTPRSSAPPCPPAALVDARRLADEGRWTEAARACANAIDSDKLNAVAYFYQALILEQLRRHADAEQSLRRAIYLDRTHVLAHYHLALLLGRTDRRDSALLSLRTVQRLLEGMEKSQLIPDADGLTAGDLAELADMHHGIWQK